MKSPRLLLAFVLTILGITGLCWWTLSRPDSETAPLVLEPEPAPRPAREPAPAEPPPAVAIAAPEIPPDLPEPKRHVVISPEAVKEMDDVQFMLRDFRARLGGNPSGTNAEIMKAIMGQNAVKANYAPATGLQMNDAGELLDRWGTPYFFHSISAREMEIRSYGPDRAMYTDDDIVVK